MFHDIGLAIQDTKCEIYNPSSVEIESHTCIPITTKGISILGIPVGKEDFMSEACVTIAKHGENLCHQLLTLGTQELLRFCHLPRMFYLSRSVKSKSMQAAAVLHDRLSCSTFPNLYKFLPLLMKVEASNLAYQIWWFWFDIITRNIKLDFCVLMGSFCA